MTLIYYGALVYTVAAFALSSIYLRRYKMTRPPIGVFNLWDVLILVSMIILFHYLAVTLPLRLMAGLLDLASFAMLYITTEPILPNRWAGWLVVLTLVGLDVGTRYLFGPTSLQFFFVNSAIQTLIIIGIANLWVQSGLKARDVVVLVGSIGIFDFVATSQTNLMNSIANRLSGLPFEPFVAGTGFGDVLFITLFALVMDKAYGKPAGIVATIVALGVMFVSLILIDLGVLIPLVPIMTPLTPLIILQYLYWRRQQGVERTMWQFLNPERF